jgi:hypothetical protein
LGVGRHDPGAEALKVTRSPLLAASAANLPDLDQARDGLASR